MAAPGSGGKSAEIYLGHSALASARSELDWPSYPGALYAASAACIWRIMADILLKEIDCLFRLRKRTIAQHCL